MTPERQGRGIASRALELLVADVRARHAHPRLTAFPSVDDPASNVVCAKGGFERRGEEDFAFRGTTLHVAVWALEL